MEIQIFTESLIKKAKLSGRYSTADSYLSTLHRLQLFTNAPDMHFDKITPELIKAFEQHLFQKGLFDQHSFSLHAHATIYFQPGCHCRSSHAEHQGNFRECFRRMWRHSQTSYKASPYQPAFGNRLKPLSAIRIQPWHVPTQFLFAGNSICRFSLFTQKQRKWKHINLSSPKNGTTTVYHHRKVCCQNYKRYACRCKDSAYLLPILTATGETGYRQYKSALRLYNKHLHRISDLIKITPQLTSYVARHTWASTARENGIPVSIISTGMGHSSEKVTYVYLESLDNKTMSDANKKVISAVTSKRKNITKKKSLTY